MAAPAFLGDGTFCCFELDAAESAGLTYTVQNGQVTVTNISNAAGVYRRSYQGSISMGLL